MKYRYSMRPLEKSKLPWYEAAADYYTDKYVRGLVAVGMAVSSWCELGWQV